MDRFYVYKHDNEYIYLNIEQLSEFILSIMLNDEILDSEIVDVLDKLLFYYDNDDENEHIIVKYNSVEDEFIFTVYNNDDETLYSDSDINILELEGVLKHDIFDYILKIEKDLIPNKILLCIENDNVHSDILGNRDGSKVINAIDFGMKILKKGDCLSLIKNGNFITCEMIDKDFAKVVVKTENVLSLSEGNYDDLVTDNESIIMITMEDKIVNTLVYGDGETKETFYVSNGDTGFEGLLEIITNPNSNDIFKNTMGKIFKKITKHVRVMKERKYRNENKRWEIEG